MRTLARQIVIDCQDVSAMAEFWGQLLERPYGVPFDGWGAVDVDPMLLSFQQVPEAKSSPKNRLHLDIEVDDLIEAAERAESLGATRLTETHFEDGGGSVVMRDIEENEFCFVLNPGDVWINGVRAALTLGR